MRGEDGAEMATEADAVVWAGSRQPCGDLFRAFEYSCDELHAIGDAVSPRSLCAAIHERYRLRVRI